MRIRSLVVVPLLAVLVSGCSLLPGPQWSSKTGLRLHPDEGPAFPQAMDGWQFKQEWTEQVRVFQDQWRSACGSGCQGFPQDNGCDSHRFLVRWRSLEAGAMEFGVGNSYTETPESIEQGSRSTMKGWAELTGCDAPDVEDGPAEGHEHHW